jgi:hypothetical protein
MQITSIDTDKNSDGNYCAWATITDGHVLSISHEDIREGGELWSKKHTSNGTMAEVMASQARNFPYFYARVATAAWRDHLSPLSLIKTRHVARDVNRIIGEIEGLETEIREKKRKIRKRKCIN